MLCKVCTKVWAAIWAYVSDHWNFAATMWTFHIFVPSNFLYENSVKYCYEAITSFRSFVTTTFEQSSTCIRAPACNGPAVQFSYRSPSQRYLNLVPVNRKSGSGPQLSQGTCTYWGLTSITSTNRRRGCWAALVDIVSDKASNANLTRMCRYPFWSRWQVVACMRNAHQ